MVTTSIYITYDNEALQDGLGAQALRITGTYAVAKGFGLKYVHSPILAAIEDVSHTISDSPSNEELIIFFNSFFAFPGEERLPADAEVITIRSLTIRDIAKLIIKYRISRKSVVIRVLLPMPILDKISWLYWISARVIRETNRDKLSKHSAPALVAHVRRGYDEKYADRRYTNGRHLPFSFFTDILRVALDKFPVDKNSRLVIHTDLVNKLTYWRPKQRGVIEGFEKNSGKANVHSIELEGVDLMKEIQAPGGYLLDIHYCDSLISTFLDMCTAKVLIQGRSALSYLSGLINPNVVIWPEVQTHAKLRRWYSSSRLGVILRDEMLG